MNNEYTLSMLQDKTAGKVASWRKWTKDGGEMARGQVAVRTLPLLPGKERTGDIKRGTYGVWHGTGPGWR